MMVSLIHHLKRLFQSRHNRGEVGAFNEFKHHIDTGLVLNYFGSGKGSLLNGGHPQVLRVLLLLDSIAYVLPKRAETTFQIYVYFFLLALIIIRILIS